MMDSNSQKLSDAALFTAIHSSGIRSTRTISKAMLKASLVCGSMQFVAIMSLIIILQYVCNIIVAIETEFSILFALKLWVISVAWAFSVTGLYQTAPSCSCVSTSEYFVNFAKRNLHRFCSCILFTISSYWLLSFAVNATFPNLATRSFFIAMTVPLPFLWFSMSQSSTSFYSHEVAKICLVTMKEKSVVSVLSGLQRFAMASLKTFQLVAPRLIVFQLITSIIVSDMKLFPLLNSLLLSFPFVVVLVTSPSVIQTIVIEYAINNLPGGYLHILLTPTALAKFPTVWAAACFKLISCLNSPKNYMAYLMPSTNFSDVVTSLTDCLNYLNHLQQKSLVNEVSRECIHAWTGGIASVTLSAILCSANKYDSVSGLVRFKLSSAISAINEHEKLAMLTEERANLAAHNSISSVCKALPRQAGSALFAACGMSKLLISSLQRLTVPPAGLSKCSLKDM